MSSECVIEIHGISETLLQRLDQRARESGRDRSQVIQAILMKELGSGEKGPTSGSFDSVLAPIRQGFAESGLGEDDATALMNDGLRAVLQEKRTGKRRSQTDPQRDIAEDEHILNLAIESQASYILTFDNDLLDLMDFSRAEGREFRRRFPTITILRPGEMISELNARRRQQGQEPSRSSVPRQE